MMPKTRPETNLIPRFFFETFPKSLFFASTLAPNTVLERVYDRTVGALVPIGRALTNKKPTKLDTE